MRMILPIIEKLKVDVLIPYEWLHDNLSGWQSHFQHIKKGIYMSSCAVPFSSSRAQTVRLVEQSWAYLTRNSVHKVARSRGVECKGKVCKNRKTFSKDWQRPTALNLLRAFLGLLQRSSHFIWEFWKIFAALKKLAKKNCSMSNWDRTHVVLLFKHWKAGFSNHQSRLH